MDHLTFLAVHAHPDDEASSTGGLYRLLATQGVRTVLVCCTNGECGDAGMKGWPQTSDPESFWATPVSVAAEQLAAVLREERPQVIMTYNEYGFYGHPDHIQAHLITLATIKLLDYEPTLYFNAIPDSVMVRFRERWEQEDREQKAADAAKGLVREPETPNEEEEIPMGTPAADISAAIDISDVADSKFDALAAHQSQIAESFWMKMGREQF